MNKVYACSDLHGCFDLWEKISAYCDETDTIYFLGDALDRGPDGIKLMRHLLADKRVIYLKGNHEDMFVDYGVDLIEIPHQSLGLWYQNGGEPSIEAFQKMDFYAKENLIRAINRLPFEAEYINKNGIKIKMNHSGWDSSNKDVLSERAIYRASLWDRKYLHRGPKEENTVIVHGHTPVPYMEYICPTEYPHPMKRYEVFKYCRGKKINIDLASFESQVTALLDLDTLEPVYFNTLVEGETYIE